MSELTDRLRRTPGVFITRKQLEAMLDVMDAAEYALNDPLGALDGVEGLDAALARFREVAE